MKSFKGVLVIYKIVAKMSVESIKSKLTPGFMVPGIEHISGTWVPLSLGNPFPP